MGVYDPQKNNRKKVYQLFNDDRINFYASANYSARSDISKYIRQIIDEISAREKMKAERQILKQSADMYKVYSELTEIVPKFEDTMKPSQKKFIEKQIDAVKSMIVGNID